ncbi:MAG: hypothetical protein AAGC46_18390, partial [Solirubrobacteraceae bacterium]|nr:hypothetical protein [Patulibacter sp.]
MKILVLSARRPSNGGRGDQKRAWFWATQMTPRHDVTLVTLGLADDEPAPSDRVDLTGVRIIDAPAPVWRRALAAVIGLMRGVPLQTSWTSAGLGRRTVARLAADHDVVIALTARVVTAPVPTPLVIDHIDAMSLNMRRRAGIDPSRLRRLGARLEARLMARHERRLAGWAAAQVVTTAEDASALPAAPEPVVLLP